MLESTAISRPRATDLIPGYRLEKMVGKGGMGEVHKAIQLSLGRTVAVKLLSADLAQDATFVTRFEKEAAALATLNHPHVVAIVDKGKAKDTYFLVMEFVDGPSLREVMRSPLLDTAGALKIAVEICRAIDYAHGRGVIHRDLKPENILFDEQAGGIPKVSDFGLASFLDDTGASKFNVTETHVSMGTLSYMAPEQRVDAKSADHRADLYSLGVILYELLVGEVPMGNFDPPSQRKSSLDKRLDAIVARCLRPVPDERYQKVSELLAELEPLAPVSSFSMRPQKVGRMALAQQIARRTLRYTLRGVAAVMVLAATGVLTVGHLRSRNVGRQVTTTAEMLGGELPDSGADPARGRITDEEEQRTVVLGEGPDQVPLRVSGRRATVDREGIVFGAPGSPGPAGRLELDLSETEGNQVQLTAELTTSAVVPGFLGGLKASLLALKPDDRTALMLVGNPGRYVAVVVSGEGNPVALEWALGERRGTMLGFESPRGPVRVELNVDRGGELRAYVGSGKDRRLLGEPLALGASWRKHFGRLPAPGLACADGGCHVRKLTFDVKRDPPPPPPPPAVVTTVATAPGTKPGVKPVGGVVAHKPPPLVKKPPVKPPVVRKPPPKKPR